MNPHKFLQDYGFTRRSLCSKFYGLSLNGFTYTIKFITNKSFEIVKENNNVYLRHRWFGSHVIDSEDITYQFKRMNGFNDVYVYIENKKRCFVIDSILKTLT